MVWFKIDDGFATSEPVMRIPRRYRASVIGLWTLSGTWCAKELTDGRFPLHMLEELACTVAQAEHLVTCGLWSHHPEGYEFIGWSKYQPTRAEVEEQRRKEADRKAHYRLSHRDTTVTKASVPQVSQRESAHPDPTRPDPTRPLSTEVDKKTPRIDLDRLFDDAYLSWPKKVQKDPSRAKFKTACKSEDPHWLVTKIAEFGEAYAATTDKKYIPALASWLHQKRWTDELPSSAQVSQLSARSQTGLSTLAFYADQESNTQKGIGQ